MVIHRSNRSTTPLPLFLAINIQVVNMRSIIILVPNPYRTPLLNPGSHYVGGIRHIPSTMTDVDHFYLAFEGVGIHDKDTYILVMMQVLLWGGGSFSAGKVPVPYITRSSTLLR